MTVVAHLPPYRVDAVAFSLPPGGVDWAVSSYGLPALWQKTQGDGVRVAVLDTGVEPGHKALAGAVVQHRNFTKDASPYDTNGHGTHVAGVVAARGEMTGVAPKSSIVSCKVLGNDGCGSMDSVAKAIHFASEEGCRVAVLSLGAPVGSRALEEAVRLATGNGMVIVCAAGNDGGRVAYPAAYGETIAVGAVDREGRVCEFSARGREIDVAAPGWQITSTWIGGGYATLSGTSMAAPFVAGVLALAIVHCGAKRPQEMLRQSSTDAGPPGRDDGYGWGLINPMAMLGKEVCEII